jgi:hypothetical protein
MKVVASTSVGEGSGTDGGDHWEGVDSKFGTESGILALAWGNSRYAAAGHNGKISLSEDGKNWNAVSPGAGTNQSQFTNEEQISCIIYGKNGFAAGGNAYSGNASKIVYSD